MGSEDTEGDLDRRVAGVVEGGKHHGESVHHGLCVVQADDGAIDGEEKEDVAQG